MRLIIWLFLAISHVAVTQAVIPQANDTSVYIVSFEAAPLALIQTQNQLSIHKQLIKNQQKQTLDSLSQYFNRQFTPQFSYVHVLNAISLTLTPAQAKYIASLSHVKAVTQQSYFYPDTDAAASMVNADKMWTATGIEPLAASQGEDIVVAILDTGINLLHESFSDQPEDNYAFASHNPFGVNTFVGWCDPNHPNYDSSYVCNNKIIGAWDFVDVFGNESDGPLDDNFHGTHMAGVIGGNYLTAPDGGFVFSFGGGVLNAPFISGIAPHTHMIIYDVCDNSIGCPASAILAAIEQAIVDDVDIINLSLSAETNPWAENSISMALLNASHLGIITSTSAGNATAAQPNTFARVNNLAPWVMTAANSFHGRTQSNDVSVIGNLPVAEYLIGMYSVISDGVAFMADISNGVIYAKDVSSINEYGCMGWNPLDFDNAVALIQTSLLSPLCSPQQQVQNAQDAGAIAVVLFDADITIAQAITGINTPTIPATMLGQVDANNLIEYLHNNAPNTTQIEIQSQSSHKIVNALGRVLYHSSLRGPNVAFDISKPDMTAPGTDIFAAIAELGQPFPQYFTATGTSQAAAVMTGSMALVKTLRPNLSPAELKSVLMLGANTNDTITFENGGATNFDDIGSGMLDVVGATNTVLVMSESTENFFQANPNGGGSPKNLNLASMRDNQCGSRCSWVRKLTNTDTVAHSWVVSTQTDAHSEIVVSETEFRLRPNQTITLDIEYRQLSGANEQYRYAKIILTDTQSVLPAAQLTVVVYLNDLIFNHGFE